MKVIGARSFAAAVMNAVHWNPAGPSPGQACGVGNDRSNCVALSPEEGVIAIVPAAGVPGAKALTTLATTPTEQIDVATNAIAKASCR